jgi:putative SOS response-associated peptidase YedK
MCGRFAQAYDDKALKEKFRLEDVSERIQPKFNMSPGMKVNTILESGSKLKLSPMLWGFSELHGKPLPSLIINSRIETLTGDSHLGQYLIKHRCVIPVTGFYEWSGKQPYFIRTSGNEIMCLAGVFTQGNGGSECSVVTTASEGILRKIHHRMPLILDQKNCSLWLNDSAFKGPDIIQIKHQLEFDLFKVTPNVNSTDFESEECVKKMEENTLF